MVQTVSFVQNEFRSVVQIPNGWLSNWCSSHSIPALAPTESLQAGKHVMYVFIWQASCSWSIDISQHCSDFRPPPILIPFVRIWAVGKIDSCLFWNHSYEVWDNEWPMKTRVVAWIDGSWAMQLTVLHSWKMFARVGRTEWSRNTEKALLGGANGN